MNAPWPEGGDLPPGRKVNILLVDDQPNNLLALEAVLDHPGYNLVKAHSGEEALRRLLRDDFALILMDVLMPGIDGFETAEMIRQRERNHYMPIIFVTAIGQSEAHVARGYSAGAVDYLFKPLIPEVLRSKVAAFVELFRKTEEVKRQGEQLRELERREHEARLATAQRQLEEERRHQEMRMARVIQQKLFPALPPACPGFEIWGASYPADETGGDYFDYINLENFVTDIVVADVSGHGYGPALIMAATRAYLRALAMTHAPVRGCPRLRQPRAGRRRRRRSLRHAAARPTRPRLPLARLHQRRSHDGLYPRQIGRRPVGIGQHVDPAGDRRRWGVSPGSPGDVAPRRSGLLLHRRGRRGDRPRRLPLRHRAGPGCRPFDSRRVGMRHRAGTRAG